MILYQYLVIHVSFSIFVIIKILCNIVEKRRSLMHDKHTTLKSIPETNENVDEVVKWVPKRKHEVLKAKYKCLKKLFQIYDASVIGILPETEVQESVPEEPNRRRRRSYRTKTDACAGTSENTSGDVTQCENDSTIATAVIEELRLNLSSQNLKKTTTETKDDKCTQDSKENISLINEKYCGTVAPLPTMQLKRKPTRFQSFIQRLLGISHDPIYNVNYDTKVYASSDNNISNRYEKTRRRRLQYRKIRRLKKIHSDIGMSDAQTPVILSYVQSIQRSCLLDTTPRQCPILGCRMIFYGIINYHDHLNLCHFPGNKHVCHYCHEGFVKEHDKIVHENEHIGITKLTTSLPAPPLASVFTKTTNITQTDVEEPKIDLADDKLKKIVAFFEKIQDPDKIFADVKKTRISELNLQKPNKSISSHDDHSETDTVKTDKSNSSCRNLQYKPRNILTRITSDLASRTSSSVIKCKMCGECFDFRRQLSLHVDLEHRVHDKFSKFHSCVGIMNGYNATNDKAATLQSTESKHSIISECTDIHCEPSANIVYYTSNETISKKPSVVNSLVQKVRTGFCYKWEPGTKIIRV